MPLVLRPTDYTVFCGDLMGRIYEQRGGPDDLRWRILDEPLDMRTDGRAATLEAAKATLETWRRWLAWAKLGELQ